MKCTSHVLLIGLLLAALRVCAQDSAAEPSLNVLRAPSSPAATMLGISESAIERPSDPADFAASVQTATDQFSMFPSSYAVDLAPGWLFLGDKLVFGDPANKKVGENLLQSGVLSLGTTTTEDNADTGLSNTQVAVGIKASVFRGHKFHSETKKRLEELRKVMQQRNSTLFDEAERVFRQDSILLQKDDERKNYVKNLRQEGLSMDEVRATKKFQQLTDAIVDRKQVIRDSLSGQKRHTAYEAQIIEQVEQLQIKRVGFKMDVHFGMVMDFPGQKTTDMAVSRWGGWLTMGYECEKNFVALGIARMLLNPDQAFADDDGMIDQENLLTFDAGARMIYSSMNKFSASGEFLYRSILNQDQLDPSYRLAFNASYEVAKNKLLTFSIGRDFDGTVEKGGNVFAAINAVLGFGSNRNIPLGN